MKLLNLGCGNVRPKGPDWINIDHLHEVFPDPECLERQHMDSEPNYLDHDLLDPLPFDDNSIEGISAVHVLEHFTLLETDDIIHECHRVLKPGGVIRISTPCPEKMYNETLLGRTDWGEPCLRNRKGELTTFMDYALFFNEHKQILGKYGLFCLLYNSGFRVIEEKQYSKSWLSPLITLDARQIYSLFVEARK